MALAIDASSPAIWALTTGAANDDPTGASASFTPPNDSLLVVCIACDTAGGTTPTTTVSGGGWTYTSRGLRGDAEGTGGYVEIYTAPVTTGASMTITATVNNMGLSGTSQQRGRAICYVVTGQGASPIGAAAENSASNTNWTPAGPTTTAANSMVFAAAEDWNASGSPTSSDLTETAFSFNVSGGTTSPVLSGLFGYKTVASAGATTLNFDAAGTGDWNMVALEIKEAGGGGGGAVPMLTLLGVG